MIDKLRIPARVVGFIDGTEVAHVLATGSDPDMTGYDAGDVSLITKLYSGLRRDGSSLVREVTDDELDSLAYYAELLAECSDDDPNDRRAGRRMLDTINKLRQDTR